jgi:O-antigen biosynthesis protein
MRSSWGKRLEHVTFLAFAIRSARLARATVAFLIHNPGSAYLLAQNALSLLKQGRIRELCDGFGQTLFHLQGLDADSQIRTAFQPPAEVDPYEAWLEVNTWNDRCLRHLTERLHAAADTLPRITIIVVVSAPSVELLRKMLSSVKNQVHQDWELCVIDDCSPDSSVREILAEWEPTDKRIRVVSVPSHQGAAAATSDAVTVATGDFLAFVNQHDELSPDALAEMALYIAQHPETDFIYSDHDTVDVDGLRHLPQFKPDWSPELLLSCNYCGHLVAVRRSLFLKLEGLSLIGDSCQDYDLALRSTELARHVGHIPSILYHRRQPAESPTLQASLGRDNDQTATLALRSAFQRRGIEATPYRLQEASDATIPMYGHEFPDNGPSVGILISSRDPEADIDSCVQSLAKTTYENYAAFVLDRSGEIVRAETCSCGRAGHDHGPVTADPSINWAHLTDSAVERLHTDYVLFLDASIRIEEPRWLSRMMGYAQIENVGAVGARIAAEDGTILDAGVALKAWHGMPDYALRGIKPGEARHYSYPYAVRNCSAVGRTCMLTPRSLFLRTGGFDSSHYPHDYHDLDYCLRLRDGGFRIVHCAGASLVHKRADLRFTENDEPEQRALFRAKYRHREEIYCSPHLISSPPLSRISPRKLVLAANRPVRTLMFTNSLNLTGAPYCLLELAKALKDLQVIDPVVMSPEDGPLHKEFEDAGIPVQFFDAPLEYVGSLSKYENLISLLARTATNLGCGIIYGNTLRTWYAIESARLAGLPAIWNIREGEPWEGYFGYLPTEMEKRALDCYAYPYRIVFVSDAAKEVRASLESRHNFVVIHDSLDTREFNKKNQGWQRGTARESLNLKTHEVAVLLLGTVCARKGQHDFPRALAKLPAQLRESLRCFIVGDRPGTYSTVLRRLVSELPADLRDRITIVGETPDTAQYYFAADLFVCTSRLETYARVILEAMAYGLPIVTTPVPLFGGIREQSLPEFNALFYEPGNIAELAEKLEKLISDDMLRKRFAANSQHVLNSLTDFDEMVESYAEVFREAYFSKGRPV